jgi:hypothetical protein
VAACEEAWRILQHHHPEIPDAVIVLGTGIERGRLVKLGHWWGGQWIVDDGRRAEVLLAGEALHLDADAVFEVLVHEAAHGINAARGIKDTSRGGRYHNAHFKAAAEILGLRVARHEPYGWAATTLDPTASARHADAIAVIAGELRLARHVPTRQAGPGTGIDDGRNSGTGERLGDSKGRASGRPVTASCECGRRLRMAPTILAAGPVTCGRCGANFEASRLVERPPRPDAPATRSAGSPSPAALPVDRSFMARRRQALAAEDPRSEPFAEGLQHLEAFEAALVELAGRDGDAEARRTLEVFRERRADIIEWLADVATAAVVPFPLDRRGPGTPVPESAQRVDAERAGHELDLRTVELPNANRPIGAAVPREPPTPEVGR